jgi:hypothetical protein
MLSRNESAVPVLGMVSTGSCFISSSTAIDVLMCAPLAAMFSRGGKLTPVYLLILRWWSDSAYACVVRLVLELFLV